MTKYICIILSFTFTSIYAQNISGEIKYGVNYVGFSQDTSKMKSLDMKESFLNFENKSKQYLKKDDAFTTLKFNHRYALYQIIPQLEMQNQNLAIESVALQTDNYLIDIADKEKYQFGLIKGKDVLVDFNRDVEWVVLDEFKNILGYKCQKAVSKVGDSFGFGFVEAWFTSEIPFSIGPHSYTGLPGTILELEVKGRYIYATEIIISEDLDIEIENKYDVFTQEKYVKMKRKGH